MQLYPIDFVQVMTLAAFRIDRNGTLTDAEGDGHRAAFSQTIAGAGLDWEWFKRLYGELLSVTGGKERMRFNLDCYWPDRALPADLEDLIARLRAAKTRCYTKLLTQGGHPLRPGVARLLAEAGQWMNKLIAVIQSCRLSAPPAGSRGLPGQVVLYP